LAEIHQRAAIPDVHVVEHGFADEEVVEAVAVDIARRGRDDSVLWPRRDGSTVVAAGTLPGA
jgi:hypothetical protein